MKRNFNVVANMILSVLGTIRLVLGRFNECFLLMTNGMSCPVTNSRPTSLLSCRITTI